LLLEFTEVPASEAIIDDAIVLRRDTGVKVPDAIIAESARLMGSIQVKGTYRSKCLS
jgi:hypothetical protein